jgi:PKD repeat protein
MANTPRFLLIGLACFALTACGGGGGGSGGTSNQSPTASFTATPSSGQVPITVAFDASASSDPDGSIASYSWNFGDNATGTGVSTTHSYTSVGTFTVTLTVTDNRGARATTTRTVTTTAGPPPASVMVSGRITFERVPFSTALGSGLDYTRTFEAPAREIEVELLLASSQAVLATTATDTSGNYTFTTTPNTDVIVRAKALTRHTGVGGRPASWDLRVRNNTNGNALYVLDSSSFNTGVVSQTRNLNAATGWGGGFAGVYTGVRAAAPFAVLDTLYSAVQFVIAQGDSGVQLPALNAFWSERNVPTDGDVSQGQIGTTAYYPTSTVGIAPGIYVLGAASNDTDEFDQHIIAHEFQHYLEDTLSRADTVGGDHSLNERLDMRVAFSEGYANAFSAMVLNDPLYRDSFGTAQGTDFHFSVESTTTSTPGWYNEASVHRIVWDLFDTANDGADTVSVGYAPMHNVFTTELRNDVPLTSLFPFITALKQRPGVPAAHVDTLVEAERGAAGTNLGIVSTTMTPYAATETFSGVADSSSDLVLPVYTPIALGGSARLCASSSVTAAGGTVIEGSYNKLGNRRFLRFNVPSARSIRITLTCASTDADCTGAIVPDPDFVVSRGRSVTYAESSTPRFEQLDYAAAAGDHVLEVYEWSHIDPDATASERRGRTCMTVNITG